MWNDVRFKGNGGYRNTLKWNLYLNKYHIAKGKH